MAILTNAEGFGESGVSQGTLINHILHIEALIIAICQKLDGDSGVNGTNYQAKAAQVIASGAVPIVSGKTVSSIRAEFIA